MNFKDYEVGNFYDEMFESNQTARTCAQLLTKKIESLPPGELKRRQAAAERSLYSMGITFNVYGEEAEREKIWPFDVIPHVIESTEWNRIEKGLKQRIQTLNLFLDDVYNDQKIIKDKVIPEEIIRSSSGFLEACIGLKPPHGIWPHITGTDLIRDQEGQLYVLEDNMRVPSGVSYVLANRNLMKRTFPEVFNTLNVKRINDYPTHLLDMLSGIAPPHHDNPQVALLTPGIHNSAYFEHTFLAQQIGAELVEGRDLVVSDGYVSMRTTHGLQRVDMIYRRIDDLFLDPNVFHKHSTLGAAGLMDAYRAGRVAIANAPGTGVADDKVIYAFVPQMIKYYLDQESLIPNVPTYICADEKSLAYTLSNLDTLVVKPASEAGGYGMLVGPPSSKKEQEKFADKIKKNPRNYIAQPTIALSRAPVIVDDHFEGRHVDLRPLILYGKDIYVLPGGLTRVALPKDSLVVNSSQGGGSKDTWVV
ncbi:MAG: circularly permuted type 2 ATP-grasp protein [Kiritimatiellae bacterium]|nr:circularly permuted type 2 ATP-grasp protein [Kiritimatiellia bacterium]